MTYVNIEKHFFLNNVFIFRYLKTMQVKYFFPEIYVIFILNFSFLQYRNQNFIGKMDFFIGKMYFFKFEI